MLKLLWSRIVAGEMSSLVLAKSSLERASNHHMFCGLRFLGRCLLLGSLSLSSALAQEASLPPALEKPPSTTTPPVTPALETPATHALLIEGGTNTVLLDKNAHQPLAPSSMTKIMTAYYVLHQLKQGNHQLKDTFTVSENAYKTEGSRMFLEVGEQVTIEDLLKGALIQSGNDACVTLAEGFCGHERIFAEKMTQLAHELGAKDTFFTNSSGLPDPNHYTTAHDLVLISQRLIKDFPEEYKWFSQVEFTHNGIKQGNRNPLLYKNIGADGVKTGNSEKAGYGMVASVRQGDRRLFLVVNGLSSMNARAQEAQRLIDWGIREYDTVTIAQEGQQVDQVDVAGGQEETVSLVPHAPIQVTLLRNHKMQLTAHLVYKKPLMAPLDPSVSVAKLILKIPGKEDQSFDLYADHAMGKAGLLKRVKSTLGRIIYGSNVGKS